MDALQYQQQTKGLNLKLFFFGVVIKLLGLEKIHKTSYQPKSNGMVERWHRSLKAAIMCACESTATEWYNFLPTVLLGLRTRIRLDVEVSPAEMLFGQELRFPGDFLAYE